MLTHSLILIENDRNKVTDPKALMNFLSSTGDGGECGDAGNYDVVEAAARAVVRRQWQRGS